MFVKQVSFGSYVPGKNQKRKKNVLEYNPVAPKKRRVESERVDALIHVIHDLNICLLLNRIGGDQGTPL